MYLSGHGVQSIIPSLCSCCSCNYYDSPSCVVCHYMFGCYGRRQRARYVPFLRPVCPVDGCHQHFPDVHGCQVRGGGASRARRHCCESIKAPVTTSPTNTSGREMKSRRHSTPSWTRPRRDPARRGWIL